jgi:hypothetical protein
MHSVALTRATITEVRTVGPNNLLANPAVGDTETSKEILCPAYGVTDHSTQTRFIDERTTFVAWDSAQIYVAHFGYQGRLLGQSMSAGY